MNKKSIVFIINPISGTHSKDEIPALIETRLDHERYDYEIQLTGYAGHATEIARNCVARSIDAVVAVGGDGTVNEVARALTHSETALGIIPCGSGNGLARHLCIPMDSKKAIDIINACNIELFDYGVINDLPFFCTCGMGFDAFISLKFAEAGKRGPITYVENVLKEGLKYKPETYQVESDDGAHRYKAFLIACANAAQYGNNAYIAPRASMQDGLLDVIVMEPFTVFEAPQMAIDLFAKTLGNNHRIKTFQARRVHIHREREGAIHYDGDPMQMGRDIDVTIEPMGLKAVINPLEKEDAAEPNKMMNAMSWMVNSLNLLYNVRV